MHNLKYLWEIHYLITISIYFNLNSLNQKWALSSTQLSPNLCLWLLHILWFYKVLFQLQFWLFCCRGCGCCWAVTITEIKWCILHGTFTSNHGSIFCINLLSVPESSVSLSGEYWSIAYMLPNPTTGLGPFWILLEKKADAFLNFLVVPSF